MIHVEGRMWTEAIMAYFKAESWNFPRASGENHGQLAKIGSRDLQKMNWKQ
jgi:hypothetical protein